MACVDDAGRYLVFKCEIMRQEAGIGRDGLVRRRRQDGGILAAGMAGAVAHGPVIGGPASAEYTLGRCQKRTGVMVGQSRHEGLIDKGERKNGDHGQCRRQLPHRCLHPPQTQNLPIILLFCRSMQYVGQTRMEAVSYCNLSI